MVPEYPQTSQELESQLSEQLDHIRASAERFDEGVTSEAKRLALAIRILVHDRGSSSQSLLGQLGRKGIKFFDSAPEFDPTNLAGHWGLVVMAVRRHGPQGSSYLAPLDDLSQPARLTTFDQWWNAVVFQDSEKRQITRRGLILSVADQDGGAHVDPTLNDVYAALSRQNSLGWRIVADGKDRPADPPHLHAVRQIAHEVLKTLIPAYRKMPIRQPGTAMFSNLRVTLAPSAVLPGRNDPCYCGSGTKFKKCHGAPRN